MAIDGRDPKWFKYTDDDGAFWSVKADKEWGDDAESGLLAFDATKPVLKQESRQHPRYIILIDPNTGRTINRVVGTVAADAWATTPYTVDVAYPGKADAVVYTRVKKVREAFPRVGPIVNKLEPGADAP